MRRVEAERIEKLLKEAGIDARAVEYLKTGSGRYSWDVIIPGLGIVQTRTQAEKVIRGEEAHLARR